jgi:hypothetical protein
LQELQTSSASRVPHPLRFSKGGHSRTQSLVKRESRSLPVNRDSRSLAVNIADDCSSPPHSVLPPLLAYHATACPASHTGPCKIHILSLHACVQGIVSLDSTIEFLDNLATPDGPALLPLSPLGSASGISSFSGHFSGTCGKTGGGEYMSGRIVFLGNSQPLSEVSARSPAPETRLSPSVGFLRFSAISLGLVVKAGEGAGASGNSELSTRDPELGTRNSELVYQLANFQRSTYTRLAPSYLGLVY